jgi:AraC family transcriptional regulator
VIKGACAVETAVDFSRGRVEVRTYDWRREWNGIKRARPDMYVLELNLSRGSVSDVAFISPHARVCRNIASGRRRALLCMFDRAALDAFLPRDALKASLTVMQTTCMGRTQWLMRNIYQEMRQGENFGSSIMIESFANALAVELARQALRGRKKGLRSGGIAPWRMRLVRQRLLSNVSAPHLTELAELCSMSVRHFTRAFKAETGVTAGHYVEAVRAEHARTLLSETNLSLNQVAHRLGFATSATFAIAFWRATGLKPRQIERPVMSATSNSADRRV